MVIFGFILEFFTLRFFHFHQLSYVKHQLQEMEVSNGFFLTQGSA